MTPGAWIGLAMIAGGLTGVVVTVALFLRHIATTPKRPTRRFEDPTDTYRLDPIDRAAWEHAEAFWRSPAGITHDIHNN